MGNIQQQTRLLVQRVGIDPVGTQKGRLALPLATLALEALEFCGQFGHLLVDLMAGMQTALTIEGVETEIADQSARYDVESEPGQNST